MRWLMLVASLIVALPATAAQDLMDIYRLAQQNDPRLKAADAARLATREARPQAKALLLPDVRATGDLGREREYDHNPGGETAYVTNQTYALSLTQPLYRRDRWIQLEQADSFIAQAEAEYAAAEQDLVVRVSQAYFDVLSALDNLEFARSERVAIGRQLEQARKRFEVGMIAITDVHEAQAAYDLAQADELAAENQLANAREALAEITGQRHGELAGLGEQMPLERPDPDDMSQWTATATENNLRLRATQYAAEAARQEIERQRSGHYPTVDATASHTYRDANFGGVFPLERSDTAIGLRLAVPLYQGGLVTSQTAEARYGFQEAQQNVVEARRSALAQTRNAYRGVVTDISRIKALQQAKVSNQSALEATEAGFEVGTRTIVDVLLAQRNLFRARRDHSQTRHQYIVDTLRLKQAAGTLSPEDIQGINRWLTE